MARVSEGILPGDAQLSLTLDRYQEIMDLPIAAFNGLNNPDETPTYECNSIWKQSQRDMIATHLLQAEERREEELGYHLAPKYVESERHDYAYSGQIILNNKHFIEAGVKTTEDIQTGVALTHSTGGTINDPVEVSVATTVDKSEIRVFYPDEDVEIHPSSISISGGTATIKIPRSRLVKPDLLDNRDDHLKYDDDDNFLETVDVKRVYSDPADAVLLIWTSRQLARLGKLSFPDGSQETQTAVTEVEGTRAKRLSYISAFPATYNGSWTGKAIKYGCAPARVEVSYKSGIQKSMRTEITTARFAHTLMPHAPVSCPYVKQYWKEDVQEANWTPYGNTAGAMEAWLHDSRARIGHGGHFR